MLEIETLILREVNQKEKDNYHMISLISGISYMAQMNLSTEKKTMDMDNRLGVAKRERGGTGRDWDYEVNTCKLLPLECVRNEILLYNPGNYVWSLVMQHDNAGKRMYTCMCDWVTFLCSRNLAEHSKSAIMEKIKIIIKRPKKRVIAKWFKNNCVCTEISQRDIKELITLPASR